MSAIGRIRLWPTMRIVINHLTRMQQGFMCVAGIDLATGNAIRPVLDQQLRIELLAANGGPFALRRIIDLGETKFVGRMPEIEDQRFELASVTVEGEMAPDEFQRRLASHAATSLRKLMGPELQRIGSTAAVPERRGLRSLGCLWATDGQLTLDTPREGTRPRIKLAFRDADELFRVTVTDIHLYGPDHVTPDELAVARVNEQLCVAGRFLLAVGLSRPYRRAADDPPRHWLQVNNLFV